MFQPIRAGVANLGTGAAPAKLSVPLRHLPQCNRMLFGNPLKVVATIRPGMSIPEAERIVARAGMTLKDFDGLKSSILIRRDKGQVVNVHLTSKFTSAIKLYGVGIGMTLEEVAQLYPNLTRISDAEWPTGIYKRFLIPLPQEGYDLSMVLIDNRVAAINLTFLGEVTATEARVAQRNSMMEARRPTEQTADPDRRLQLWAQTQTGLAAPQTIARFLAWLPTARPEDWHKVAASWNWGFGVQPLSWIISQRACSISTATLIFFDGEPIDVEPTSEAGILIADIRARWSKFTHRDIAYEPPRYVARLGDTHLDRIPINMRTVIPGSVVSTDGFHEGIPILFFRDQ